MRIIPGREIPMAGCDSMFLRSNSMVWFTLGRGVDLLPESVEEGFRRTRVAPKRKLSTSSDIMPSITPRRFR